MDKATLLQRIVNINHPFTKESHREKPLREYIPGAWPTWGEFLDEMTTYDKLKRDNKALLGALKKAERALTELYPSEPCKAEHEAEYYAVNAVLNEARAAIKQAEEAKG